MPKLFLPEKLSFSIEFQENACGLCALVCLTLVFGIRLVVHTVWFVAGIVNRGDSFRRRRSRSNSLCPPLTGGGTPSPVSDAPEQNHTEVSKYRVALVGTQGVGKTALISQFMTSECINAYDHKKGW